MFFTRGLEKVRSFINTLAARSIFRRPSRYHHIRSPAAVTTSPPAEALDKTISASSNPFDTDLAPDLALAAVVSHPLKLTSEPSANSDLMPTIAISRMSSQTSTSMCHDLSPQSTATFLSTISSHIKSIQTLASVTKSALKRLPDSDGSSNWYKKQLATRNYDARMEMLVMSIWQIEPARDGYLDYLTVTHLLDLVSKLCTDVDGLANAAIERGISGRDLKAAGKAMANDVARLASG